jgi:hypothetical protein
MAPGRRVAIATWAAVADSPGYAALVDVVARTVGEEAADAIREPFCLSDPAAVGGLVAASFADVEVHRHHGVAHFDSIESMVRAEIRGWTLSDTIDGQRPGDQRWHAPLRAWPIWRVADDPVLHSWYLEAFECLDGAAHCLVRMVLENLAKRLVRLGLQD